MSFASLSLDDLSTLLASRDLPTDGTQEELVARLTAAAAEDKKDDDSSEPTESASGEGTTDETPKTSETEDTTKSSGTASDGSEKSAKKISKSAKKAKQSSGKKRKPYFDENAATRPLSYFVKLSPLPLDAEITEAQITEAFKEFGEVSEVEFHRFDKLEPKKVENEKMEEESEAPAASAEAAETKPESDQAAADSEDTEMAKEPKSEPAVTTETPEAPEEQKQDEPQIPHILVGFMEDEVRNKVAGAFFSAIAGHSFEVSVFHKPSELVSLLIRHVSKDENLREKLEEFCEHTFIEFNQKHNYCIATLPCLKFAEQTKEKLQQNSVLENKKKMQVDIKIDEKQRKAAAAARFKRTIYLKDIAEKCTEQEIEKIYAKFGRIVSVTVPQQQHSDKAKGFGFVEFFREESANKAVKELPTFSHLGKDIQISIAKAKGASDSGGQAPNRKVKRGRSNSQQQGKRGSSKRGRGGRGGWGRPPPHFGAGGPPGHMWRGGGGYAQHPPHMWRGGYGGGPMRGGMGGGPGGRGGGFRGGPPRGGGMGGGGGRGGGPPRGRGGMGGGRGGQTMAYDTLTNRFVPLSQDQVKDVKRQNWESEGAYY